MSGSKSKSKGKESWESLGLEELQSQHRRALNKLQKKDKQIKELRANCTQLEQHVEELESSLQESQRHVLNEGFGLDGSDRGHTESVFGLKLVLKEGWMLKKGRIHKTYKRRFFVLKSDFPNACLVYYKHRMRDVSPSGEIVFGPGCSVSGTTDDDTEREGFPLIIDTPKRKWMFLVDSEESRESWLQALYSIKTS